MSNSGNPLISPPELTTFLHLCDEDHCFNTQMVCHCGHNGFKVTQIGSVGSVGSDTISFLSVTYSEGVSGYKLQDKIMSF